jgi:hypothetical protein
LKDGTEMTSLASARSLSTSRFSLPGSINRILFAAATFIIFLAFTFVPNYELNSDEMRAFLVVIIIGVLYLLALMFAQRIWGWARLAPIVVTMNALLITIFYAFLYRVLPSFWLLYFNLPIFAVLLFGAGWTYLSGALSAVGYLTVLNLHGSLQAAPISELLNASELVAFSLLTDGLGGSLRRQLSTIENRLAKSEAELQRTYLQVVMALANAVEAKDTYTSNHAERLRETALAVGRALNMNRLELEEMSYAAILHDIGKIGVPDQILKKTSRLDPDEWSEMRKHPRIGAEILMPIPHLAATANIVSHHHERYDGKGYPDGLARDEIPLGARILAVVDSYSAIVDARAYKQARDERDALAEIKQCAGSQFDPLVVDAFLQLADQGVLSYK